VIATTIAYQRPGGPTGRTSYAGIESRSSLTIFIRWLGRLRPKGFEYEYRCAEYEYEKTVECLVLSPWASHP